MKTLLPWWMKLAAGLTFFNTWVLFEETVIDREGVWKWLPFYQYAHLCAWDVGAALLIGAALWRGVRRLRVGTQTT